MDISIPIGPVALAAATVCISPDAMGSEPQDTAGQALEELTVLAEGPKSDLRSSTPKFTISAEDMKGLGVADVTGVLRRLPGVNVRDYGGAGGLKTLSVRGLGANHTAVLYDGVAMTECRSGQTDLSRYSLDQIGSIALQIGDNNDLLTPARLAASASGISITSHALPAGKQEGPVAKVRLTAGSFGLIHPFASFGIAPSERISIGAMADFTHALNDYPFTLHNGLQSTREKRSHSLMNAGRGEVGIQVLPDNKSGIKAKAYWYDSYRQLPGQVVLYNPTSNETLRERNAFGQATYRRTLERNFDILATGRFNWDASNYRDVHGKYPGGALNEDYYQREVYMSGVVRWQNGRHWQAAYAADFAWNDLYGPQVQLLHPKRNTLLQTLSARYANRWIDATVRILYTWIDNSVSNGEAAEDANRLSPSVSISVRPLEGRDLFVRAGYKRIFRMPTFNDTYYWHLGSLSLKPEDTDQWNLGVAWDSGTMGTVARTSLTADVYFNCVKNQIVAIPQNMYMWSMTNLDRTRAYGIDLTAMAEVRLGSRQTLSFNGNYSFQRVMPWTSPLNADYKKQMAYTPMHSGAASLEWGNPWVSVVVNMAATGAKYGTNSNLRASRIGGFTDFGATLRHSFPIRGTLLTVEATMLNIFNRQYEVISDYPMPGRRWQCSLEFKI